MIGRKVMVLPPLAVALGGPLAYGAVVVQAQIQPAVTFVLPQVDPRLANASWTLETGTAPNGTGWVSLASGTAPAGGQLSIPLSLQTIGMSTNHQFLLLVIQPSDSSHEYMGAAMQGPSQYDLIPGATITFQNLVVDEVQTYATRDAATAAASCPTCSPPPSPPDTTTGSGSAQVPALPEPPVRGQADFWVSTPHNPDPTVLAVPVSTAPACYAYFACAYVASATQPTNPGSCSNSYGFYADQDCTEAVDNIFGVTAFRGFSNKIPGDNDTFWVSGGYGQTFDNGFRNSAGPFSKNGSTSKDYASSTDITYPLRGDCWSPAQPGDDTSACDGEGFTSQLGQDTWRWEQHTVSHCSPAQLSCQDANYELLFDSVFDGGTGSRNPYQTVGDGEQPTRIKSGSDGDWSKYDPGSTEKTTLHSASSVTDGADISIDYSDSFGPATFQASEMNTSSQNTSAYTDAGNTYVLRGPSQGLPFMGAFYHYDGFHEPWQWEYWSCQFAAGWVGAMNQTQVFQGNTQCWDASQ